MQRVTSGRIWSISIVVLALLFPSTSANSASLVLAGPAVIHVGDTVTYALQIDLAPGETFRGGYAQFAVENGRSLASWVAIDCDCHNQRGFFFSGYRVDIAGEARFPVALDGGLSGLLNAQGDQDPTAPDLTPEQGPFTLIPFTLTALAPGELRFVAVPGDFPIPITSVPVPEVSYISGGQTIVIPPPSDGVWARIQIVPESPASALALLGAAAILWSRRRARA
jgi:hypothetical protein